MGTGGVGRAGTSAGLLTALCHRAAVISKAQVSALCAGDGWLEKGANLLLFGPPGGGKSHLASAIGLALVEKGWRVLFARTSDLVQRLQIARREFDLEAAIQRRIDTIC